MDLFFYNFLFAIIFLLFLKTIAINNYYRKHWFKQKDILPY